VFCFRGRRGDLVKLAMPILLILSLVPLDHRPQGRPWLSIFPDGSLDPRVR
jgi:hypothetical protein